MKITDEHVFNLNNNFNEITPLIEQQHILKFKSGLKYAFSASFWIFLAFFSSVKYCGIITTASYFYHYYFYNNSSPNFFEIWMMIEVVFLSYMSINYMLLRQMGASHLPVVTKKTFQSIKQELFQDGTWKKVLEGHFQESIEKVTRQDLMEWISCLFFNSTVENLTLEQDEMVLQSIKEVENKMKIPLKNRVGFKSINLEILCLKCFSR